MVGGVSWQGFPTGICGGRATGTALIDACHSAKARAVSLEDESLVTPPEPRRTMLDHVAAIGPCLLGFEFFTSGGENA